jgi:hypothetical protein
MEIEVESNCIGRRAPHGSSIYAALWKQHLRMSYGSCIYAALWKQHLRMEAASTLLDGSSTCAWKQHLRCFGGASTVWKQLVSVAPYAALVPYGSRPDVASSPHRVEYSMEAASPLLWRRECPKEAAGFVRCFSTVWKRHQSSGSLCPRCEHSHRENRATREHRVNRAHHLREGGRGDGGREGPGRGDGGREGGMDT